MGSSPSTASAGFQFIKEKIRDQQRRKPVIILLKSIFPQCEKEPRSLTLSILREKYYEHPNLKTFLHSYESDLDKAADSEEYKEIAKKYEDQLSSEKKLINELKISFGGQVGQEGVISLQNQRQKACQTEGKPSVVSTNSIERSTQSVILILGKQGVGKTQFINNMINCLLGIKYPMKSRVEMKGSGYESLTLYEVINQVINYLFVELRDWCGGKDFKYEDISKIRNDLEDIGVNSVSAVLFVNNYQETIFDPDQDLIIKYLFELFDYKKDFPSRLRVVATHCKGLDNVITAPYEQTASVFYPFRNQIKLMQEEKSFIYPVESCTRFREGRNALKIFELNQKFAEVLRKLCERPKAKLISIQELKKRQDHLVQIKKKHEQITKEAPEILATILNFKEVSQLAEKLENEARHQAQIQANGSVNPNANANASANRNIHDNAINPNVNDDGNARRLQDSGLSLLQMMEMNEEEVQVHTPGLIGINTIRVPIDQFIQIVEPRVQSQTLEQQSPSTSPGINIFNSELGVAQYHQQRTAQFERRKRQKDTSLKLKTTLQINSEKAKQNLITMVQDYNQLVVEFWNDTFWKRNAVSLKELLTEMNFKQLADEMDESIPTSEIAKENALDIL